MNSETLHALPPGATDCHAHVYGPHSEFPYFDPSGHVQPEVLPQEYRAVLDKLGFTRAVIVQPSIYGTDNRCTLAGMAALGLECRGVVAVQPPVAASELARLHQLGVRGVRVNRARVRVSRELLRELAGSISPFGWHLQLYLHPEQLDEMLPLLGELPVDCVIDHMGMVRADSGVDAPVFGNLLRLLEGGRTWVKLSAGYRLSTAGPPYADCAPMARALYAAAPERCVWGTDWPHPKAEPFPDVAVLLQALRDWLPDQRALEQVLVDNPAVLYGFGGNAPSGGSGIS